MRDDVGVREVLLLEPSEVPGYAEEIVACYRTAFTAPPWNEHPEAVEWFATELPRYASTTGFACAVAIRDGDFAGFGLGFDASARRWWRQNLTDTLGPHAGDWLPAAWLLAELAVLPRHRGRGLGAAVHDALAARIGARPALLTTHPGAAPALRLYRTRGWRVLSRSFEVWPYSTPQLLLGRDEGHRSARMQGCERA